MGIKKLVADLLCSSEFAGCRFQGREVHLLFLIIETQKKGFIGIRRVDRRFSSHRPQMLRRVYSKSVNTEGVFSAREGA